MITMTVKAKNIQKIIVLVAFIGALLIFGGILYSKSREINFSDSGGIMDFIQNNGYTPIVEDFSERKVTIPYEFNSCYESYNEIQKLQGFDLSKYSGKDVTIYRVKLDIHGEDEIYAEVLLSGDVLIGADVINLRGGEILPLIKKENSDGRKA